MTTNPQKDGIKFWEYSTRDPTKEEKQYMIKGTIAIAIIIITTTILYTIMPKTIPWQVRLILSIIISWWTTKIVKWKMKL